MGIHSLVATPNGGRSAYVLHNVRIHSLVATPNGGRSAYVLHNVPGFLLSAYNNKSYKWLRHNSRLISKLLCL
jgi:hypothetical protein